MEVSWKFERKEYIIYIYVCVSLFSFTSYIDILLLEIW